ncbi:VOC family protein [Paenibacillus senegalensis]|uniref:VOC family protein n=1 Tax=Paenibacillus senegalensis TaxID=1465766 RepID=UPI0002885D05|nr:VOC family protein [Paenibacillus senegalensis]
MEFSFTGIDHVQLAAPPGCEDEARHFFVDVLGWQELQKPKALQQRGGVWFVCGPQQVHIGVQNDFAPALKAHPAFLVKNLPALKARLLLHQIPVKDDEIREDEGIRRFFSQDPFGNRLEFMETL